MPKLSAESTNTGETETATDLELDGFEEDEEGGAGVVLHVVVQAERLQTIHNQSDPTPFQGI